MNSNAQCLLAKCVESRDFKESYFLEVFGLLLIALQIPTPYTFGQRRQVFDNLSTRYLHGSASQVMRQSGND
jgi:hypothetical protein